MLLPCGAISKEVGQTLEVIALKEVHSGGMDCPPDLFVVGEAPEA